MSPEVDLFLELTFAQVAQSQAVRTWDGVEAERPQELSHFDSLADARGRYDR